ncbi:glycine-rich cell wall structural protein 1.0-like [Panicum miliaceum]|uniref:Glycine-rich cell wall structural protein 1.0-like n=1 Tax=Panicum miliaceum TaxID=4540 RepID=A0A3L6RP13_PANMI|nr:glycine-rich cell wall structural protein 1.0-like [Panicum miliaceum]
MTFSQENSVGGGGRTHFPSTPHMDASMYASFPSPFTGAGAPAPQHAGPGYWSASNAGGSASFPSPFNGAGGISAPHQHVRTGNYRHTGAGSSAGHELYRGNGNGGGSEAFPSPRVDDRMYIAPNNFGRPRSRSRSPLQWSMEQLDDLVGNSLRPRRARQAPPVRSDDPRAARAAARRWRPEQRSLTRARPPWPLERRPVTRGGGWRT